MGVTLFGIVELHYVAVAGATLHFYTDLPGNAMTERETLPVPASPGHRTVKFRLQGTTKGKLYRAKVTSAGLVFLFGGRVFARQLGTSAPWTWFPLPITATPDEWSKIPLPITKTADEWSKIKLPIAATPDDWTALHIPMDPTPDLQEWIDIPVAP